MHAQLSKAQGAVSAQQIEVVIEVLTGERSKERGEPRL